MAVVAEYIWIDGAEPTRTLRSKTKIMYDAEIKIVDGDIDPGQFPEWGFDGSSTNQAEGDDSDCMLKPAYVRIDPIRPGEAYLVMCEVFNFDGTPHSTNTRAELRRVMDAGGAAAEPS